MDDMEKRKFLPYLDLNSGPSVIQPVALHYMDCAIPAPNKCIFNVKNSTVQLHAVEL
jgi:hypothetical protein